jgi:alkanesulfonate monooxygenase SsuD/methylene tetrahydromethanopterin reductase-like flavin-dependent oxidoreductase (luciferase family)
MPLEFGLQLKAFPPDDGKDLLGYYDQQVEALPPEFTSLWVSDHFQFGTSPVLEGWTWLTYLAARYPRFKVGHLVLGQGYRNPALLAKMGATLQVLSSGRFILGLGAGWHEEEYRAYGYGYPSRAARVEQLAETLQIIRLMWTEPKATFHGKHYAIEGAICAPKPDPIPPIFVGSPGPKVIRVAAQYADGWTWDAPIETYGPPHAELVRACAEIGRDPATVWKPTFAELEFPDDPANFEARYEHPYYPGMTMSLIGPTPAAAVAQLEPLIALGVSHIIVFASSFRTIERFSAEAIPELMRLAPVHSADVVASPPVPTTPAG